MNNSARILTIQLPHGDGINIWLFDDDEIEASYASDWQKKNWYPLDAGRVTVERQEEHITSVDGGFEKPSGGGWPWTRTAR